ncbi:MAG: hypothetical protein AAGJ93_16670 [Bacteroidota bacterium]
MKNLCAILILTAILFAGCKDENPTPACEIDNFGVLTIINNSTATVDIEINRENRGGLISGGEEQYIITAGNYSLYVEQRGSNLAWEDQSTIDQCETKSSTLRE